MYLRNIPAIFVKILQVQRFLRLQSLLIVCSNYYYYYCLVSFKYDLFDFVIDLSLVNLQVYIIIHLKRYIRWNFVFLVI